VGEAPKVFVRRTSGLVRTIGPFAAMVFGVHCISLSSSGLIPYAWVPWLWPGADLIAILTVAMIMCIFHALTYSQIGSIYPRSGADYVLASRVFHPLIQFPLSFGFLIFTFLTAGALIAWIPSAVLPSFLKTWAVLYKVNWLLDLATWVSTPQGVIVVGLIFTLITFIMTALPTKRVVELLQIGFFLGVLSWVLIYIAFIFANHEIFVNAWNTYSEVTYNDTINLAKQNGLVWGIYGPVVSVLAGLIMGFWIYYGYYIPSFFAGELKEAPRTLPIGMLSSLIFTWAVFTGAAALMYPRLMSLEFMASAGYLYYNTDIKVLPFSTYYASILWAYLWPAEAPIAVIIIMIGFVYTLINLAQTYFFYGSRLLFAMSFDRALPGILAYVTKGGVPIVSMSLASIIAGIGVILSQTTVIFVQFNFVLYASVMMLPPVVATILFPWLRKEEYERAPKLVSFKIKIGPRSIPGITVIGAITLGYLIWMILASWLYPAVGGAIGPWTIGWYVLLAGLGLIIFLVSRWHILRKEGVDILWAYKEIPPL
jgi:amino acid transporter